MGHSSFGTRAHCGGWGILRASVYGKGGIVVGFTVIQLGVCKLGIYSFIDSCAISHRGWSRAVFADNDSSDIGRGGGVLPGQRDLGLSWGGLEVGDN